MTKWERIALRIQERLAIDERRSPLSLQERREVDHGRLMDSVIGVPTGLNTLCLDTFVNLQTGPHASGHTAFYNTQHSLANYMS